MHKNPVVRDVLLLLVVFGGIFAISYLAPRAPTSSGTTASVEDASATASYETLPTQPTSTPNIPPVTVKTPQYEYIEVVDSCGPYYQGDCVNMRSGPGMEYPVVLRLRTGIVLKVAGTVTGPDGNEWYKIAQDAELRYPERITSDWYVAARVVAAFNDDGDHRLGKGMHPTTTKRIVIDLEQEMLSAYDGDTLFMQEPISTGLDATPTPRGTFTVYYMTPSRYMQGPIPGVSSQSYDLPGVPWNLYFTQDGAVIHGAYWHDHFGQPWSHGCVNLPPDKAKELYEWAELGMKVTVK